MDLSVKSESNYLNHNLNICKNEEIILENPKSIFTIRNMMKLIFSNYTKNIDIFKNFKEDNLNQIFLIEFFRLFFLSQKITNNYVNYILKNNVIFLNMSKSELKFMDFSMKNHIKTINTNFLKSSFNSTSEMSNINNINNMNKDIYRDLKMHRDVKTIKRI